MIQDSSQIPFELREILDSDNTALAEVIKQSLVELGLNKPGTVFGDPETNSVSEQFKETRTRYWVVEVKGKPIAGAGINYLKGADDSICELQKMYVSSTYRKKGFGQLLIETCLQFAKQMDFEKVYLETMEGMDNAILLYKRNGFKETSNRLGTTGHFDCKVFMVKDL